MKQLFTEPAVNPYSSTSAIVNLVLLPCCVVLHDPATKEIITKYIIKCTVLRLTQMNFSASKIISPLVYITKNNYLTIGLLYKVKRILSKRADNITFSFLMHHS